MINEKINLEDFELDDGEEMTAETLENLTGNGGDE